LYLNGQLAHTGLLGSVANVHPSAILGSSTNGDHYAGELDDFRVWNTSLTADTIFAWQRAEVTAAHPNYTNLMCYWKLSEGAGTNTFDSTTNGINARLTPNIGLPPHPAWTNRVLNDAILTNQIASLQIGTAYH